MDQRDMKTGMGHRFVDVPRESVVPNTTEPVGTDWEQPAARMIAGRNSNLVFFMILPFKVVSIRR
ncbi:hypothetical protein HMI48_10000 [Acidithiobacillus ferrooxidans]|uniref:hypothetical protein n=1 Tax=Acidithiobacillus ferrooxidans TaxID=920 RepID=UPI001C077C66|nr:hypothetical protein [Acidithiobacillus ferrooxidans]MBU2774195.1 hypothetical protein [Acidithiobacillus ferrooxidans]